MQPEPFELHAFNTLPRPSIEAALEYAASADFKDDASAALAGIFPYLFKPNRAAAWARDPVARFPLEARNLRWLFRVPGTPGGTRRVMAVIGTDGGFSLWRYDLPEDPDAGGGLAQLAMIPDGPTPSSPARFLSLNRMGETEARAAGDTDRSWGFFYLKRALCASDVEGGVRVRLLGQGGEHYIDLDLGDADQGHQGECRPVRYIHQFRPLQSANLSDVRQIGGWDATVPCYWDAGAGAGTVFSGSSSRPQYYKLPGRRPGLKIRTAAASNGWVAVGGDDERLWVGRSGDTELKRGDSAMQLPGYARTLTLVSRGDEAPPFILVGCDDHFLHVLDHEHRRHQKIDLGGVPEAILHLGQAPDRSWDDLALLVRDRGLMCLRLLRDRLQPHESDPVEGCESAAPGDAQFAGDRQDRQRFLDCLQRWVESAPECLPSLLGSPVEGKQLLGLALLLHRPERSWVGLDLERALPLDNLRHEVIAFIAHSIKRLMEPLALGQVKRPEETCERYLKILEHLAQGPHRARVAVRQLEGWLIRLRERFKNANELSERVDKLIVNLPDAKRSLRKGASAIKDLVKEEPSADIAKPLGALAALTERLRSRCLFNEIILAPVETSARVDATAIVRDPSKLGLQVFGQRGRTCLSSFRNRFSTETIAPVDTARSWPEMPGEDGISNIRALVPLGHALLLVVLEDRVLVIPSPNESPLAVSDCFCLLDGTEALTGFRSAAVRSREGGFLAAIGIEWLPGSPGPVILLELDAAGRLVRRQHLPPPLDWRRRLAINALAWDPQGNPSGPLWATTNGPGYLLKWSALSAGWSAEEVRAIGSPQYAVQVISDDRIVLGGQDGVLRSFDGQGRLQWARTLPGAVIGICGRRLAAPDEWHFAPIAVITERDTITLYDYAGRQIGRLELTGHHLTALASAPVAPARVQHHLIGTLKGEVRLLEEVPAESSHDPLLLVCAQDDNRSAEGREPDPKRRSEDLRWDGIRELVSRRLAELGRDLQLCQDWIATQNAYEDPSRACWAARALIREHGEFSPVLDLLKNFPSLRDADAQELRTVVFGSLGEHLDRLPCALDERFIDLCRDAIDGPFASLFIRAARVPVRPALWESVLKLAKEKIRMGYPFVSSAVLQYLHPAEADSVQAQDAETPGYPTACPADLVEPEQAPLQDWLEPVLKANLDESESLHPGFAQGLMGIVLRQIGYSDKGVLNAFAKPEDSGAALMESLRRDPNAPDALLNILERYSGVLLSGIDHGAWCAFAPALRADPETLYDRLRAALDTAPKEPDVVMLGRHLALFRDAPPAAESAPRNDPLSEISLLTDDLQRQLYRVHSLQLPADQSSRLLQGLDRAVAEAPAPSPLVAKVHAAWQHQWRQKIALEQNRITGLEQLEAGWKQPAPEAMRQVFRVMHDAGFSNGRYYAIHHLPGCAAPGDESCIGLLELLYWTGSADPDPDYPRRYPLNGVLARRIAEYSSDAKPGLDVPVCKHRAADEPAPSDAGLRHWQEIWHQHPPSSIFEIPVLCDFEHAWRPYGLFVFDIPKDWANTSTLEPAGKRLAPSTRSALLLALEKVAHQIRGEARAADIEAGDLFDRLEEEMLALGEQEAMQPALLRTAVKAAHADDGLMIVRSSVSGTFHILCATPRSQEIFQGVHLNERCSSLPAVHVMTTRQPLSIPWFEKYPHVDEIRLQLEKCFAAAGKPEDAKKWLDDFKSALVLPLEVDGEPMCAISLRYSKRFAFSAHDWRATQTLLQRYRWYFTVLRINEERRHSINAFVHQLRTDLQMLKHPLEALVRIPEQRERWLTTARRQLRKLSDMSQNFLDTGRQPGGEQRPAAFADPGAVVEEILRDYLCTSREFLPVFHCDPADFGSPLWHIGLCGRRDDFERVLRNLIDNAVKYGRRDVRVSVELQQEYWRFSVSNPGAMTPEEDEVKFKAFVKPKHCRFDGSHVGLAASRGLAKAIEGNLELENRFSPAGEPRVVALLTWPVLRSPVTSA